MPRLSTRDRERAVGRLQAGQRPARVAAAMGVAISTICRLWVRYNTHGHVLDTPRSGRPRVTTPRQDRVIHRHHTRAPFTPAAETGRNTLGRHGAPVSGQTVRRRLRERGLYCRRPARQPVRTARHTRQRLQWARQRQHWTWRQWSDVLFTDESRYCIGHADGRIRVWRRRNQRFANNNVQQVNAWGGPSIMVWGGMRLNLLVGPVVFRNIGAGRGNGVTAARYIQQVLGPAVVPHIRRHPNLTLQQDNARPHTARLTTGYLQQQGIRLMEWPSMSPDLNPIEHLWDHIQREIDATLPRPTTAQELEQAFVQAWGNVNVQLVNRLIRSMPARCRAVIAANGGHTHY